MKNLVNKKGDKVVRVPDKKSNEIDAILDLLEEGWKYCPNHKWRAFRDSKVNKKTDKKADKRKAKKKTKTKK